MDHYGTSERRSQEVDNSQELLKAKVKKFSIGIAGILILIFVAISIRSIFEDVDSKQLVICQRFYTGTLEFWDTPGMHWQLYGSVQPYSRSTTFSFSSKSDQGSKTDESILTRFNDGGHAKISGTIRVDFPTDREHMIALHQKYGSEIAAMNQLVRTVMERAIYFSGPLMSSRESYSEKRSQLAQFIEDQAKYGTYKVTTRTDTVEDPLTKEKKQVTISEPVLDKNAPSGISRTESSPVEEFGIRLYNLSINGIQYDEQVEKQIIGQQEIMMAIQTKIAEAKKAEQDRITATERGRANAETAKWEQEAIKQKAVTAAEQEKAVAEKKAEQEYNVYKRKGEQELIVAQLAHQAAEEVKSKLIAEGQGEATKRRLIMEADGALSAKLDAFKEVNFAYAKAFSEYKGAWVPSIVMGGSDGKPVGGVDQLVQMLTAQTAKGLSLDMSMVPPKK